MRAARFTALLGFSLLRAPAWGLDVLTGENGETILGLKSSLVGSLQAYPGKDDADSFWRLRLEPSWKISADVSMDAAWDMRGLLQTGSSTSSLLPSFAPAFFRIVPLDFDGGHGEWVSRQSLDRAWIAWQPQGASVIVGRQAIGWGRGEFFGAVDIFAPFSPLELDREWRPGVDALQADLQLTDQVSVGAVIAPGSDPLASGSPVTLDDSAFAARVRGRFGGADGELIAGRRGADLMLGLTGSLPVWDAEAHAEAALFLTSGDIPDAGLLGNPDLVPKAVLGMSNHFAIGGGLDVSLEYHYSGFGVRDLGALPDRLADPAYKKRYLRGDTQIPGKQALSVLTAYDPTGVVKVSCHLLQSLVDFSGAVSPAAEWSFADGMTLTASGVFAFGATDAGGRPRSQFGDIIPAWIVQIRIYY